MSATISVRKLDSNWDPIQGNGQANFITDIDAVAQIIATRIKLLQGEWWENLNAGTPLFQQMLGVGGSLSKPDAMAAIVTQRILGTPYVNSVSNVSAAVNAAARSFSYSATVSTQFGALSVNL